MSQDSIHGQSPHSTQQVVSRHRYLPCMCVGLDTATDKPLSSPLKLIPLARRVGTTAIEAPCLIRHDDHWYLFVSFDQCCRGVHNTYRIMVGRSKRLTSPYLDYTGRPTLEGHATPMLASHDHIRGPGHNCVVRDGDADWLIHHFYNANRNGAPAPQVRRLLWAEDGWPLPGEPLSRQVSTPRDITPADLVETWRHSVNFGSGQPLQFLPRGRLNEATSTNTWRLAVPRPALRWPNEGAPGGSCVDTCNLLDGANTYIGRNQQGALVRGTRTQ